jgi:Cystathionine beta-lyase family protein involved in aluminum resistance
MGEKSFLNWNERAELTMKKVREKSKGFEKIAFENTLRVLEAFRKHQVSDVHFATTTGYGYGDMGREKLDAVWATVFGAESALVRHQFVSGTHALSTALFGCLRPGDSLLSVTGTPYDTLQSVIGKSASAFGSLKEWEISYNEIPFDADGDLNWKLIKAELKSDKKPKVAMIQRSRGYGSRKSLSVKEIGELCDFIHLHSPTTICFVDNCYGEFVEVTEPTMVGADLMAGSLIKNPGGGLAPTGGYICGRADLVEAASHALTAPGLGNEMGSSNLEQRLYFQGLFQAPQVVAQALQSMMFAAYLFEDYGFSVDPLPDAVRSDIIQSISLGNSSQVIAFCQGLQAYSPINSHVMPIPSGLPGYEDEVIMAAGTFIQGASIEISADAPMREPFTIFLQGGVILAHSVWALLSALNRVQEVGNGADFVVK